MSSGSGSSDAAAAARARRSRRCSADKGAVLVAMADAFSDRLDKSLANLQKEAPGQIRLADDQQVRRASTPASASSRAAWTSCSSPRRPCSVRRTCARRSRPASTSSARSPWPSTRPASAPCSRPRASRRRRSSRSSRGFCWRYSPPHRETFKRLHDGAIGKIVAVYTTYNTDPAQHAPAAARLERPRLPGPQLAALHVARRRPHRRAGRPQPRQDALGDERRAAGPRDRGRRPPGARGRRDRQRLRPLQRDLRVPGRRPAASTCAARSPSCSNDNSD